MGGSWQIGGVNPSASRVLPFLLSSLLVLAGCAHRPPPVDDRTAALAFVKAHAAEEDRTECPADVIPAQEVEVQPMQPACEQRLAGCAEQCEAKDGSACYALALAFQESGQEEDTVNVLFHQACALGVTSACTNLGAGMLKAGKPEGKVALCAVRTFEKACARNDPWGCVMYARERITGEHLEADAEKARDALAKACRYGAEDPACQASKQLKAKLDAAQE